LAPSNITVNTIAAGPFPSHMMKVRREEGRKKRGRTRGRALTSRRSEGEGGGGGSEGTEGGGRSEGAGGEEEVMKVFFEGGAWKD
jgi:hypothetical protein